MGHWPGRPTPERRKQLDSALNEIAIWVCDALPPDWSIEIVMSGGEDGDGEASMGLVNPEGDEVSAEWDSEQRNLWTMVDFANNPDDPDVLQGQEDEE